MRQNNEALHNSWKQAEFKCQYQHDMNIKISEAFTETINKNIQNGIAALANKEVQIHWLQDSLNKKKLCQG